MGKRSLNTFIDYFAIAGVGAVVTAFEEDETERFMKHNEWLIYRNV